MVEIDGRQAILSEQVLLGTGQKTATFRGQNGLAIEVSFSSDITAKPSVIPRFDSGVFRLPLVNFGSTLGMAVSGQISAQLRTGTNPRPGAWVLSYSLSVHLVGDDFRLVSLTVTEARVA